MELNSECKTIKTKKNNVKRTTKLSNIHLNECVCMCAYNRYQIHIEKKNNLNINRPSMSSSRNKNI